MARKYTLDEDDFTMIEDDYGDVDNLTKEQLIEIVTRFDSNVVCGEVVVDADWWDDETIEYETRAEEESPSWSESYLNTLGMSMSDFI